ncbi:MAG: hypothetical protein QT10_C0004G0001, partial [archaeon GW2011_AR19]
VNNAGTLEFNETKLNNTISSEGVRLGFNSTYNETYTTWSYNQTTPANTYTDSKVGTADLHLHNASNITAGTFGAGNYNMSANLTFNSDNQGIKMGNALMYWDGTKLVIKVS